MNARMRAVEKRINGVKGKILVDRFLATVYDLTCQYCGKIFDTTNKRQKFCCRECGREARRRPEIVKTCPTCGKEFITRKSYQVYCSELCKNRRRSKKICVYCGKEYLGTFCQKYCSDKCRNERRHKEWRKDQAEIRRIIKEQGFNFDRCRRGAHRKADMDLLIKCVAFIRSITPPIYGHEEIMEEINNHPLPI